MNIKILCNEFLLKLFYYFVIVYSFTFEFLDKYFIKKIRLNFKMTKIENFLPKMIQTKGSIFSIALDEGVNFDHD